MRSVRARFFLGCAVAVAIAAGCASLEGLDNLKKVDCVDCDDASIAVDAAGVDGSSFDDSPGDAASLDVADGGADVQLDARADADADAAVGPCVGQPDGTVCAKASNACYVDGKCTGGVCGTPVQRADGYNWSPGDDTARCCGGVPLHTNTNQNCGACGIKCNSNNGESCQLLGGHWFCRGCAFSNLCWSGCCSNSFSPASCAASDCNGNCKPSVCPPGTHCVVGAPNSSDYCAY